MSKHSYRQILTALRGSVWAIVPDKLDAILGVVGLHVSGFHVDGATVEKVAASNRRDREPRQSATVAVLPIVGTLAQRMDLMGEFSGGTSTERIGQRFDELMADDNVEAVILDVDSPGGVIYGTSELSDRIFAARGKKPIVAVANSLMASAAYWIASAADEISATPGGDVGSIGVYALHLDASKSYEEEGLAYTYVAADISPYKTELADTAPMTPEAKEELQRQVNEAGEMFLKAVARNRGSTPKDVRENYGKGRVFGAKEAVQRGMADRVETLQSAIDRVAGRIASRKERSRRAAVEREELELEKYR